MKVGSFVYATNQGLGILAKSFYDHSIITDVLVISHGTHSNHLDWYEGADILHDLRSPDARQKMQDFCKGMDVMLFFETPFWWPIMSFCQQNGVKVALMPMHECMPEILPCCPDLMICPSELDLRVYPQTRWTCGHTNSILIPVPVDTKWRQRERAEVFVHNAGHGGLNARNGTYQLMDAIHLVRSPAQFVIRAQDAQMATVVADDLRGDERVTVTSGTFLQEDLWRRGDVFIFPEKFNGLSLPLQEARAAGMLVMCGDRFPMNTWLPREPLIPVDGYLLSRIGPPYTPFDEAIISPNTIAAKIDEWYGRDITEYSRQGREWARSMSWNVLGPRYTEALEALIK